MRRRETAAGLALALLLPAQPALAHPHVFVSVRSALVLGSGKTIVAVRQDWTFDEMYTAFAVTGFGKTSETPSPADLRALAQRNMTDMADYHYFTVIKTAAGTAAFAAPVDASAELVKTQDDYSLELHFTLPLKPPLAIGAGADLQVYDPSYFVSFTFAKANGVAFVGASGACAARLIAPKPLSAGEQASLTESFFSNMLPGVDFGVKLAQTAAISCK